ncbi:hypothetical protein TRFO_16347 [Tritrichomonas foetus]|uniref:Transmembrane protein n=1 Tax=Tritrichomonas foetus TaxID=1144522 RepID=A0A1J4KQB2_9EUKA|nr:hypothetical protein TRFO_16347 [Tritrichomonas foetus]|eukprot:OHT13479.1 hypothetical protein TRFO_16347 [Tritrichomonas foetus]
MNKITQFLPSLNDISKFISHFKIRNDQDVLHVMSLLSQFLSIYIAIISFYYFFLPDAISINRKKSMFFGALKIYHFCLVFLHQRNIHLTDFRLQFLWMDLDLHRFIFILIIERLPKIPRFFYIQQFLIFLFKSLLIIVKQFPTFQKIFLESEKSNKNENQHSEKESNQNNTDFLIPEKNENITAVKLEKDGSENDEIKIPQINLNNIKPIANEKSLFSQPNNKINTKTEKFKQKILKFLHPHYIRFEYFVHSILASTNYHIVRAFFEDLWIVYLFFILCVFSFSIFDILKYICYVLLVPVYQSITDEYHIWIYSQWRLFMVGYVDDNQNEETIIKTMMRFILKFGGACKKLAIMLYQFPPDKGHSKKRT